MPDGSVSDPEYPGIFEIMGTPVVLTHVCRRWRELSYSISVLWRNIRVNFITKSGQAVVPRHVAQCLSAWLARIGALQLSVCLFVERVRNAFNGGWGLWQHIEHNDENLLHQVYTCADSSIPWDRVEHLSLQGLNIYPREYAGILTRCCNLQSLVLLDTGYGFLDRFPPLPRSVYLPHLRHLVITVGMRGFITSTDQDILQYLNAPSLTEMSLEMARETLVDEMLSVLYEFIEASGCVLKSFNLAYTWPPTSAEVRHLFTYLPHVEDLRFTEQLEYEARHHHPFFDETSCRCLVRSAEVVLLPSLKRLSLPGLSTYPMTNHACDAALDFLESRLEHGLEKVEMELESSRVSTTCERVFELQTRPGSQLDLTGIKVFQK